MEAQLDKFMRLSRLLVGAVRCLHDSEKGSPSRELPIPSLELLLLCDRLAARSWAARPCCCRMLLKQDDRVRGLSGGGDAARSRQPIARKRGR